MFDSGKQENTETRRGRNGDLRSTRWAGCVVIKLVVFARCARLAKALRKERLLACLATTLLLNNSLPPITGDLTAELPSKNAAKILGLHLFVKKFLRTPVLPVCQTSQYYLPKYCGAENF